MANFFDSHVDEFIKASDFITHTCIEFAGMPISHNCVTPFNIFMRAFSKCDDAVYSINFDCVVLIDDTGEQIPCLAVVTTDGEVSYYPKKDLQEVS